MQVLWSRCDGGWCRLMDIDLHPIRGVGGVYVIWIEQPLAPPTVWYVGQTDDLAKRLKDHRADLANKLYLPPAIHFATWAEVPKGQRDGVETYLIQRLNPSLVLRKPDAAPIPVNLPWGWL